MNKINSTMAEALPFSCDLVEQSKKHITFLRNLHKHGVTIVQPSHEAFRRYSQLWLPLVHENSLSEEPKDLIPPADIAWLWHCHRLAPYRYSQYVQKRFHQKENAENQKKSSFNVLDASHPFAFQVENNIDNETFSSTLRNSAKNTKEVFHKMFPNESFFLQDNKDTECHSKESTKLAGFDVIESCNRQASFLWQVSGSNFSNDDFLRQGVENYLKFVQLMGQKSRPQFLVPTYQIDLMWHTHMLTSIAEYHKDNMSLNGCILEHDDSLNDRTEGGKLDTNFQATRKLWNDVYGVEYKVLGGMYRGEPPNDFFNADWPGKYLKGEAGAVKPNLLDGLAIAHLIGQVGASSHGKTMWMSVDHPDAFIAPKPKSTLRGVNANKKMDGYVFGRGARGIGYYNLQTREAYDTLINRIDAIINDRRKTVNAMNCLSLTIVGALCAIPVKKIELKKIQELEDVKSLAEARRGAAGPSSDLTLPAELEGRMKQFKSRQGYRSDDHVYYYGAAGCGVVATGVGYGGVGGDGGGDGG